MPPKKGTGAAALADDVDNIAPQTPLSIELLRTSGRCALGLGDPNAGPLPPECVRAEVVIIDREKKIGEVRYLIDLPDDPA